jgi:HK97 family phage prohead protease
VSDIEYGPEFRISEIKSVDSGHEVAGYVSTYGNVDHGGDVVLRGAFDTTLAAKLPVRFLFAHDTRQIIGLPLELKSDDNGLFGRFKISQTTLGRDVHTLLKDGALDSFSIGYVPTDVAYDDAGSRLLKSIDLLECSVVAMPMNAKAMVTAVKADETSAEEDKAVWNSAYVNSLPDSSFALVYKDDDGNKVRKLPHHDKSGAVDKVHLRNALSRCPQMTDCSEAQRSRALSHLKAHAKSAGVGDSKIAQVFGVLDEDVPFEDLLAQVGGYLKVAAEAAEALLARRAADGRKLAVAHVDAIHDLLDEAEAGIERLERVAEPPSPLVVSDGMKLRLELARRLQSRRALETV